MIDVLFAGVAVAYYHAARAWYERLLGRPPDMIPNDNEATWRLAVAGWIYVVGDAHRAGKALLTLIVDDLDRHVAELGERGFATGAIETAPGLYRRVVVTDPEGNTITFAETPGGER